MESEINDAFIRGQDMVAVFLDLESAYNVSWKSNILNNLIKMGIKGHMLHFIINFLSERKFKVKLGQTLSSTFVLENGVPQGSIISVILFLAHINSAMSNFLKM